MEYVNNVVKCLFWVFTICSQLRGGAQVTLLFRIEGLGTVFTSDRRPHPCNHVSMACGTDHVPLWGLAYIHYLRWTPHPVTVTIRDDKNHVRVLIYSHYITIYHYYRAGGHPNSYPSSYNPNLRQ